MATWREQTDRTVKAGKMVPVGKPSDMPKPAQAIELFNHLGENTSVDKDACAKTDGVKFYLRISKRPGDPGILYNPTDKKIKSFSKEFIWKEVSEVAYKSYIRFLLTKNQLHYNASQRNI
jgi:hypothetical protein